MSKRTIILLAAATAGVVATVVSAVKDHKDAAALCDDCEECLCEGEDCCEVADPTEI